ncbi:tryptophan synthase subunit alpha [Staphylococcus massiliensis]|uniref:Tryptophan synthase alpha chain n=1 Tax=Staphylococcus massiliensis S46 TaxID=1229783 RepID=K9AZY6_9STAP|nr:tryptophan synthase subunit alpha [Staphylococcus massiliensis]EKU47095.1 tryptophan synthase subunit alpha [Staphylococcus massiliensis S46]MCG3398612.1 tryptophan synthase subunit alpha [Staphylococcus massiliensis]PNZ98532.1 tryptophan synthase subunit alpha [Staphylococcus massiliensis CCUG 55927]
MGKLFVPYIMGNQKMIENLKLLEHYGADYVEIGIPFSDPVADGPIIMEAGQEAIREGQTTDKILETLKQHRDHIKVPYILMTYYHMIEVYGEDAFFKACTEAGVYGLIIPDLPYELLKQLKERHPNRKLKLISLISMTANEARIENIAKEAEGFIYTVTMNAITGQDGAFHPELKEKIEFIKRHAKVPVMAGFGIKTPKDVKEIAATADGVVIGSEIVKRFKEGPDETTYQYLASIQAALNESR